MKKLNCSDISKIQAYVNNINIHKITKDQHSALVLADLQLSELYRQYTKRTNYSKLYAERILSILYDVIDIALMYERRESNEIGLCNGDF